MCIKYFTARFLGHWGPVGSLTMDHYWQQSSKLTGQFDYFMDYVNVKVDELISFGLKYVQFIFNDIFSFI